MAIVEALRGQNGWLTLRRLAISDLRNRGRACCFCPASTMSGRSILITEGLRQALLNWRRRWHPLDHGLPAWHRCAAPGRVQSSLSKATLNHASLECQQQAFCAGAGEKLEQLGRGQDFRSRDGHSRIPRSRSRPCDARLAMAPRRSRKRQPGSGRSFRSSSAVSASSGRRSFNTGRRCRRASVMTADRQPAKAPGSSGHSVETLFTIRWAVV
jgi:hypothetical protein